MKNKSNNSWGGFLLTDKHVESMRYPTATDDLVRRAA